jgi:hypothetical protein
VCFGIGRRAEANRLAVQQHLTTVGTLHAAEDLDQRALAGARP